MLRVWENFGSAFVQARHVSLWVPECAGEALPVLYMQDGQNLFQPETSYAGVDWGVQHCLATMGRKAIVVGIWNTPMRLSEYMPAGALEFLKIPMKEGDVLRDLAAPGLSDAYLRFLVEELKPAVDRDLPTLRDPQHTFVLGSSMGGLISAYAVCRYPHVFGGAGCLSTHWPAGDGCALEYFRRELPPPGRVRFYFDYGTATIDAPYQPYQEQMDRILSQRGYCYGQDWVTLRFEGAEHSEGAWRERLHQPLQFLLG